MMVIFNSLLINLLVNCYPILNIFLIYKLKLFAMLLLAAVLVTACKEDSSTNVNTDLGTIRMKVDGESWNGLNAIAVETPITMTISGARMINNDGGIESLTIVIQNEAQEGSNSAFISFDVVPDINNPIVFDKWQIVNGTVNITEITASNIEGEFSFTATNNGVTKTFTEGYFNVSISNI